MRFYYSIITFVVFIICNFNINAQDISDSVGAKLLDYIYSIKEEKLFVHTDRESYFPKDTIWFRGYLVNATTNKCVDHSRYIYVELVDRTNTVHWREKVGRNLKDSTFSGYFPIPEISQGEYFLRCYTFYMQNQEEEFIYRKKIRIVNPYDHRVVCRTSVRNLSNDDKLLILRFENEQGELHTHVEFNYRIPGETPFDTAYTMNTGYNGIARIRMGKDADYIWIKSTLNSLWDIERYIPLSNYRQNYTVQFFPEGGDLLCGVNQRIAFKALGSDGLGMQISGHIYNQHKQKICSFESNKLGMGSFFIKSDTSAFYYAECISIHGTKKSFQLPQISLDGRALQLATDKENVVCNILNSSAKNDLLSNRTLLIHSRGMPLAIFNAEDVNGRCLNLSTSPEGVLHFVLLDSLYRVESERLWFHRKFTRDNLFANIINSPTPRKPAYCSLQLESSDSINNTGTFSVSVVNSGHTANDNSQYGIESYLLLTSDIRGYVENPAHYFVNTSEERMKDLDHLMLTQGWRRFNVTEILQDVMLHNRPYYMERGQFLSGHVKNFWGRDSKNAEVTLLGSNGSACKVTTDSVGRFLASDVYYDRGTTFVVQAVSSLGRKSLELNVDMPEFKRVERVEPDGTLKDFESFIKRYSKDYIFADNGERLKTIGVVKVTEYTDDRELSYFGQLADEMEYEYYWRGKEDSEKYGHNIYQGTKRYNYDSTYNIHGADPTKNRVTLFDAVAPIHLRQEQQTGQPRVLGYKLVPDIPWSRKLFIGRGLQGGDVNTAGTIEPVYDKTLSPRIEISFNMQTLVPSAPQQQNVEFYKPSYNVATELLKEVVDEKITRYWNPNVKLSSEYPYTVAFPTAAGDGNQTYTITIEGITENGTPIHHSFQYSL
ncbi:MAG: hypothetical protein E7071_07945 [Bacteroidales bacterium]|nr:hypothetical protein [Bacteroidales bacterium]